MSERQETHADILTEMRGNEWDSPDFDSWALKAARGLAREWAARLEAAFARELAEAEAFALEAAAFVEASRHKPARNCDVGTPEEQAERFKAYCGQEVCKRASCQFHAKAGFIGACAIAWEQMPYEGEANKEGGSK